MRIVTWNINSLNVRKDHVAAYLDRVAPDVLCLQELKMTEGKVPRSLFESRGYQLAILGQKTYNGVLIASKADITDVERGYAPADRGQARLIAGTVDGVRIVNAYCPQGQDVDSEKFEYKLDFFDELLEWIAPQIELGEPFILTGDINIARQPDDVWSVAEMTDQVSYHPEEHARFDALLEVGLVDAVKPHLPPHTFTFWDYRQASFQRGRGMRIDHFLVTPAVNTRVVRAWVDVDERRKDKPSDHAPVVLELA
ncbi:MAG: exodeoxyribonuclease III [Alphaproteobacteria bacterium]|nr:exodeoxyribonuclease III [Alphaproteobacteria bacterium]